MVPWSQRSAVVPSGDSSCRKEFGHHRAGPPSVGVSGGEHLLFSEPQFTALRLFSASRLYDGTSTEETLLGKF